MNYSITLNKFIDRIDMCIADEINNGKNFGHVNYSAYIDSESLLEATNSCLDGKEQICNNIKKMIKERLKDRKDIESFNIDKIDLIVNPQQDLTDNYLTVVERNKANKYRKYIQVKISFKKSTNKRKCHFMQIKKIPENIFKDVESEKFTTVISNYLIEHGQKFNSFNELIIYIFNNFKEELNLDTKNDISIAPIKGGIEDNNGKDLGFYYSLKEIYGVFIMNNGSLNDIFGYVKPFS